MMHMRLYVGEDGLNRSTRINTRIKRKLTFLQVSWITRKLKPYLVFQYSFLSFLKPRSLKAAGKSGK